MIPGSTLITGAAGGIGRALASACAAPGRILHLTDRDAAGLADTIRACREGGATVAGAVLDVTDAGAMAGWIGAAGRIDLAVACAGVKYGSIVGGPEDADQTRRVFAVNLDGTMNTALPALAAMRVQARDASGVRGRLAVLASLGAFVSVPGAPAYCASKAAVDAWAVGLAPTARRDGIRITSVCPGYVRTPMTRSNPFAMRGLLEPEDAAARILRAVAAGRIRAAFPWHMALAARFGAMLPAGSAALVLARRMRAARP